MNHSLLDGLWDSYKRSYVRPDGYVLDPSRDGGTVTSEGQGYALLVAAWQRDADTFDRVYRWTEANLRRADGLYSWLWSPGSGGRILDVNTATDADQEIAFALILAAAAFGDPDYEARAGEILRSIRAEASVELPDGWFPAAGDWATAERILNLSYFLPYAYPYFADVDPDGRWLEALETGYRLIERTLDPEGVLLIPDFMVVDELGRVQPLPEDSELGSDFSFDAMRIFWRIAADCRLHGRSRACDDDPLGVDRLDGVLIRDGRIFTRYTTAGEPLTDEQSPSFYASVLPLLSIRAPALADRVRPAALGDDLLGTLVDEAERYYDRNWVWFGIALEDGLIEARTPRI